MILLYKPAPADLTFRKKLLADAATMSYNAAWGGTIPFPEEKWETWYAKWVNASPDERFYRYVQDTDANLFVGEASYHLDPDRGIYLCDVIIYAPYRKRGYGTAALDLLCAAAKENSITVLYDSIASDNPSRKLFLQNGFTVVSRSEEAVLLCRIV